VLRKLPKRTAWKWSCQTLLHLHRMPPSQTELQACLMTAFLSIAASSASLFMISVRVVPTQRDAEMFKVRLFTSKPMYLGIVGLRLTSWVRPEQRLRQRSNRNSIGFTKMLAFDRVDIVYLKSRGTDYSSLRLLYWSQVSVLVASSEEYFLNGSTERNNALVTNMLKTWLADHNMPRTGLFGHIETGT